MNYSAIWDLFFELYLLHEPIGRSIYARKIANELEFFSRSPFSISTDRKLRVFFSDLTPSTLHGQWRKYWLLLKNLAHTEHKEISYECSHEKLDTQREIWLLNFLCRLGARKIAKTCIINMHN